MYKALVVGLSLSILIAACASPSGSGAENTDISVPDTRLSPIEEAIDDLLIRLGDDAHIEVVLYEEVVWRDGSLGCPQPDMAYTQALEDGYRIELTDGLIVYHYHGVTNGSPFLCENPSEPESSGIDDGDAAAPPPTNEPGESELPLLSEDMSAIARSAVDQIAELLDVSTDVVVLVSHDQATWSDSSLGCPQKGMSYLQVLTPGTVTLVEVNGIEYRYHSGASAFPFLCLIPTDPVSPGVGSDL